MVHTTEMKKPQSEVQREFSGDWCLRVLAPGSEVCSEVHTQLISSGEHHHSPHGIKATRHHSSTSHQYNGGSSSVVWSMVALFQASWHYCRESDILMTCWFSRSSVPPSWLEPAQRRRTHLGGPTGTNIVHVGVGQQVISADSGMVDQNPPPSTSNISFTWRPQLICHTLTDPNQKFKVSSGIKKNNSQHVHAAKCVHLLGQHQRPK